MELLTDDEKSKIAIETISTHNIKQTSQRETWLPQNPQPKNTTD